MELPPPSYCETKQPVVPWAEQALVWRSVTGILISRKGETRHDGAVDDAGQQRLTANYALLLDPSSSLSVKMSFIKL